MVYTILPLEDNERHLIYQLQGEAAEQHGAIGCMRADFGQSGTEFRTTWFENQPHLKTVAFCRAFDTLVDTLRTNTRVGLLIDRRRLETFCMLHSHMEDARGYVGVKIVTEDYSYILRCCGRTNDYDVYIFAFDNRCLLPAPAGQISPAHQPRPKQQSHTR